MTDIRIDEQGVVACDPVDFAAAVALVRERALPGLWIRPDSQAGKPGAPLLPLGLLRALPSLRSFGIAEGVGPERIIELDAVYELAELEKLTVHGFPRLELHRFASLRILMMHDDPAIVGLERLTSLRQLYVTGLRKRELGYLAGNTELVELHLTRVLVDALQGLECLAAVRTLQLSHCAKLRAITPLPPRLDNLRILKCGKLSSLACLRNNDSITALYASTIDDLEFVPSMTRLVRLGFEKLTSGRLDPVLDSKSLRAIDYAAKKSYSHTPEALRAALAARR